MTCGLQLFYEYFVLLVYLRAHLFSVEKVYLIVPRRFFIVLLLSGDKLFYFLIDHHHGEVVFLEHFLESCYFQVKLIPVAAYHVCAM